MTEFAGASTVEVASCGDELAPLSPALVELAADAPGAAHDRGRHAAAGALAATGLPALDRVMGAAPPLLTDLDPFLRGLNPRCGTSPPAAAS